MHLNKKKMKQCEAMFQHEHDSKNKRVTNQIACVMST